MAEPGVLRASRALLLGVPGGGDALAAPCVLAGEEVTSWTAIRVRPRESTRPVLVLYGLGCFRPASMTLATPWRARTSSLSSSRARRVSRRTWGGSPSVCCAPGAPLG